MEAYEQLVANKDNEITNLTNELQHHRTAIQEMKGHQKQVSHTVQLSVQSAIKTHLEEFIEPAFSQLEAHLHKVDELKKRLEFAKTTISYQNQSKCSQYKLNPNPSFSPL